MEIKIIRKDKDWRFCTTEFLGEFSEGENVFELLKRIVIRKLQGKDRPDSLDEFSVSYSLFTFSSGTSIYGTQEHSYYLVASPSRARKQRLVLISPLPLKDLEELKEVEFIAY